MRTRFISSLYAGLLVYLSAVFFFGSMGRFAQVELEKRRDSLLANIEELENQGESLESLMWSLQSDPDRVLREAVRLVLVREDEGIIRIQGYQEKPRLLSPGGLLLRGAPPSQGMEPLIRVLAAAAGIIVFFFLGLSSEKRDRNQGSLSQTSS